MRKGGGCFSLEFDGRLGVIKRSTRGKRPSFSVALYCTLCISRLSTTPETAPERILMIIRIRSIMQSHPGAFVVTKEKRPDVHSQNGKPSHDAQMEDDQPSHVRCTRTSGLKDPFGTRRVKEPLIMAMV